MRLRSADDSVDPRSGIHFGARSVAATYSAEVPVSYAGLAGDVTPGARVLIDDGRVELSVTRVTEDSVDCTVVRGGRILSRKGLNLPGTAISTETLTEKDRDDLRFGIAQGVDYVALSFVRSPDDVATARKLVAECGGVEPGEVGCRRLVLRRRQGQLGPEDTALPGHAVCAHGTAHECGQFAADGQTQACAAEAPRGGIVGLGERHEQPFRGLARHEKSP